MTPEGRIKAAVDKALLNSAAYWHRPIGSAYGAAALDYHVANMGYYASIETKSSTSNHPTVRQTATMRKVIDSNSSVFLIDAIDGPDLQELKDWLAKPTFKFVSTTAEKWLASQEKPLD